jgi:hypothetical protein
MKRGKISQFHNILVHVRFFKSWVSKVKINSGLEQYMSRGSVFFLISFDHSTGSVFLGKEFCCLIFSCNHCSILLHSVMTCKREEFNLWTRGYLLKSNKHPYDWIPPPSLLKSNKHHKGGLMLNMFSVPIVKITLTEADTIVTIPCMFSCTLTLTFLASMWETWKGPI